MNAYDFDDTILSGDTEVYFWKYIFGNFKKALPYKEQAYKYRKLQQEGKCSREISRPVIYRFLKEFDDISEVVTKFWALHEKFIKPWYALAYEKTDVIISGTPLFLLKPIMQKLGIKNVIATKMDERTGELDGLWNYGEEKVRRFKEIYGDIRPEKFYSDSISDLPMARLAKEAFIVRNDDISPWSDL
ncbi:MAG: HAD-IB family phosphatase [Clostridia bacterium]|nr:HAD-IB family phosphatase [Clostridia bacterium]